MNLEEKIERIEDLLEDSLNSTDQREDYLTSLIHILEEEEHSEKVAYHLWKHYDYEEDSHFRDLGFRNPEDLLLSLKDIHENPARRSSTHELKGLYHLFTS